MKILIAGVGNVLRGDDGFGVAVAQSLRQNNNFSEDVDIFEAGIAGIAFVQELMNGYDALIIMDAVEKDAPPGTIFVFEPEISEEDPTSAEVHRSLADAHYTEPSKVFVLARALKILPPRILVVGCQPEGYDELGADLSPAVKRAVPVAVGRIVSLIKELNEV